MSYTLPGAKENILAGVKLHTMRVDRQGRWLPGRKIHHYFGSYFKPDYHCFLTNTCVSTQMVLFVLVPAGLGNKELKVTIDRRRLSVKEIETLAVNDGFVNTQAMINWFFTKPGVEMWAGKIIHWTKLKY